MSKSPLLFWCFGLIQLASPVTADPFVIFPTGNTACSVEVKHKASSLSPKPGSAALGAPTITHIEITRVGKVRRDEMTWSDGNTTQIWTFPDLDLSLVEADYPGKCIYDVSSGSGLGELCLRRILSFDPASADWINNSTLVGKETHGGKPTLHYRASIFVPSGMPGVAPVPTNYEGWVDSKTLTPVAFDDGEYTYELTFNAPPTSPLVMPDRFENDLKMYQSAHAVARHL